MKIYQDALVCLGVCLLIVACCTLVLAVGCVDNRHKGQSGVYVAPRCPAGLNVC